MDMFDDAPAEEAVPSLAPAAPPAATNGQQTANSLAGQRAQAASLELWKSGKMDLGNGTERWLAMYNSLLMGCRSPEDVQRAAGLADVAFHALLVRQRLQEARGR